MSDIKTLESQIINFIRSKKRGYVKIEDPEDIKTVWNIFFSRFEPNLQFSDIVLFYYTVALDLNCKFEQMEYYYQILIERGNIDALNNLAYAYAKKGKFEEAERYYLIAIEKGHLISLHNLLMLYYSDKEYLKYIKLYQEKCRDSKEIRFEVHNYYLKSLCMLEKYCAANRFLSKGLVDVSKEDSAKIAEHTINKMKDLKDYVLHLENIPGGKNYLEAKKRFDAKVKM